MYKYRLYYLSDCDDGDPKYYLSPTPVQIGDVIQLTESGFYHKVVNLQTQKTGVRLDLSKSAQDEEEASLLAEQYGHYPKKPSLLLVARR